MTRSASAPVGVSGADLTSIELVNRFKGVGKARKPSGFDVVLHLAAPLQQGVLISVTMTTSAPCGDSSTIQLGAGCQSSKPTGDGQTVGTTGVSADRKSVTWSIDNLFKAGTKVTDFYGSTSVFVLGVFDELASGAVFTYGK